MAKIHINNPKQVINGGAKKYYFKVKGLGGPKGDKGDTGATGPQGPQGPQGNAATVSVGSTTTLQVGQDATVENVGTLYNAVLNFGIPQGPQGPQGATGAKGDKGDKGDQGNPGPQGEKGTNATVYVGTTSTLNPGSQATVYNSGTDSNAVLNFGIPKGEKGDTGPMPTIAQTTGQAIDQVMSQKATTDALNTKQATITNSSKLSADLVDDTSTTNKFVTAQDKTNWNAKQDALTAGTGIDITDGVISTPAIVPEVVTELPTTGAEGKLYLTPKAHTTSTATGNPITATITAQAGQLESFQLDGDTFQQSYTGKNLFNSAVYVSVLGYNAQRTLGNDGSITWVNTTSDSYFPWIYSDSMFGNNAIRSATIPVQPSTQYTVSCKKTTATAVGIYIYEGDSDYVGIKNTYTSIRGDASYTFTTSETTRYVILRFVKWASQETDVLSEIQLEAGSTASSYEPFVGGQPSPNPEYPQQIQTVTGEQTVTVTGKNIVDLNNFQSGSYAAATGEWIAYGSRACTVNKIPVKSNSTYAVDNHCTNGYIIRNLVDAYRADGTFISRLLNNGINGATFTTTADTAFINLTLSETSDTMRWENYQADFANGTIQPQIELGSTATAYTPYSSTDYPISLGSLELCKLGTYQDYIYKDGDDWKVHKATGSITLNGSESDWRAIHMVNNYRYFLNISNIVSPQSAAGETIGLCSHFSKTTPGGQWGSPAGSQSFIVNNSANPNSSIGFTVGDSTDKSIEFKAWLAENTPTVLYALYSPTDTTITDTTLIAQLEAIRTASLENGTNTITNTATGTNLAGDIEIGYYGFNPINRYDKFIWLDINNNYEQIGGE